MAEKHKTSSENWLKMVGARLQNIRLARDLTQVELATMAGVNKDYISMIERGQNPTLEMIFGLCRTLEVHPDAVLAKLDQADGTKRAVAVKYISKYL